MQYFLVTFFFMYNSLYLLITYPYLVPLSPLSPLVTTSLLSVSVSVYFLLHSLVDCVLFYISHISDIIQVSVFLCLIYFPCHSSLQVHSCSCKWQNTILFYGCVVFHCVSFPDASSGKNLPAMQNTQEAHVKSLDWEDALEKEMATHSSILA